MMNPSPVPRPTVATVPAIVRSVSPEEPAATASTSTAPEQSRESSADLRRIDHQLRDFFDRLRRRRDEPTGTVAVWDRLVAFVTQGGKRIRPRLCLGAYRILSGETGSPPRSVWRVAASLEIFHAFMLVHDDLIDGSLIRRTDPSLHEAIRRDLKLPDTPSGRKRAADLALIAGDLLYASGMRLLGEARLKPSRFVRVHRLVTAMLLETGEGEAIDLLDDARPLAELTESQILGTYRRKTSRYSVSAPLALGALLAGAPPSLRSSLEAFGDRIGLAYQIRNDLNGLEGDPEVDDFPDLDSGKRTLVLLRTSQRLGEAGRPTLEEALGAVPGPDRRRRLLELIHRSGAIDDCLLKIEELRDEAADLLGHSGLDADQQRRFLQLLSTFLPDGGPIGHDFRA